ncbi:MAG: T9SS type A sorting domain-containing protein [Bacteroidetes bacterium]|nr:T9SS type A sorting domain-containing protein [Bacteroidota bacterium]
MKRLLIVLSFLVSSTFAFSQGGGNMLDFDGLDDYINCGVIDLSGDQLTMSAWFRVDNFQPNFPYISTIAGIEGGGTALLRVGDAGIPMDEMQFVLQIGGSQTRLDGGQSLLTGLWYNVTATYDGAMMRLYINGKEDVNKAQTGSIQAVDSFFISLSYGGRYIDGMMDEIAVFDTALKATTIQDWMHKNIDNNHPDFPHLVGFWKFDEVSGATASDASSNGYDGTLENADTSTIWINSTVPFASAMIQDMTNVRAVWEAQTSNSSTVFSINAAAITGDDAIVFGHDNGALTYDTVDVPNGIDRRLKRYWSVEPTSAISADLFFDLISLDVSEIASFSLLVDTDTTFIDAGVTNGTLISNQMIILGHNFKNAYYTLGAVNGTPPSSINDMTNSKVELFSNYPNPFSGTTYINYNVFQGTNVSVKIYNIYGQEVETLVEKFHTSGHYKLEWSGTNDHGLYLKSGIYYLRMFTDNTVLSRQMIMIR